MTANPHRCTEHPAVEAGWECRGCGRTLCPDCVAEEQRVVDARVARYALCVHCDGPVEGLTLPGSEWTFWELVRQSLRVPPRAYFFALLGVLYVLVFVAQSIPPRWTALVWGLGISPVLWALFFLVLQAAARGAERIDDRASEVELLRDVAWPALNAVLLSLGLGAVVAWIAPANVAMTYAQPAYWAVSTVCGLLLPAVLLEVAMRRNLLAALWPPTWARHLRALGGDYALLAGVTLVLATLAFQWVAIAYAARLEQILLFPFVFQLFAILAWMVEARLLGLLLRTRAADLGWEFAADQRIPALDGVAPRGTRKVAPAPPPREAPRPIELEADAPVRTAPDLPSLASALERGDLEQAVGLYAALPALPPLAISITHHLTIGQAAAARGNLTVAVRALRTAASAAPDHPDAPKACVILARVYAERLEDAASAEKLFRYVVQRYPGTPAAKFARERLG